MKQALINNIRSILSNGHSLHLKQVRRQRSIQQKKKTLGKSFINNSHSESMESTGSYVVGCSVNIDGDKWFSIKSRLETSKSRNVNSDIIQQRKPD